MPYHDTRPVEVDMFTPFSTEEQVNDWLVNYFERLQYDNLRPRAEAGKLKRNGEEMFAMSEQALVDVFGHSGGAIYHRINSSLYGKKYNIFHNRCTKPLMVFVTVIGLGAPFAEKHFYKGIPVPVIMEVCGYIIFIYIIFCLLSGLQAVKKFPYWPPCLRDTWYGHASSEINGSAADNMELPTLPSREHRGDDTSSEVS